MTPISFISTDLIWVCELISYAYWEGLWLSEKVITEHLDIFKLNPFSIGYWTKLLRLLWSTR